MIFFKPWLAVKLFSSVPECGGISGQLFDPLPRLISERPLNYIRNINKSPQQVRVPAPAAGYRLMLNFILLYKCTMLIPVKKITEAGSVPFVYVKAIKIS
jgi:hypothetical protein